jgi:hypothetical protein
VIDAQQRLDIGTRRHEVLNLRADGRERIRLLQGRHEPMAIFLLTCKTLLTECRAEKTLMKNKGNPCICKKEKKPEEFARSVDV